MRARHLPLLLIIALGACADPVADAEKELAMVEQSQGSKADLCRAKKKVADAYLEAQQAEKYKTAKVAAEVECYLAQQGF